MFSLCQVLKAVLAKAADYHQELGQEREQVECAIRTRTQELQALADDAQKEALTSLASVAENAINDLSRQEEPVRERLSTVEARAKHLGKVVNAADDEEAVNMLAQVKAEAKQQAGGKGKGRDDTVVVQKGSVVHEFRSRAVRYADALAFIGLAKGGPIKETRAASLDMATLQENVAAGPLQPLSNAQLARKHGASGEGAASFVTLTYSKNPRATLAAMQLVADDRVWLHFNPGGNVPLFGLFDGYGQRLEVRSQKFPTHVLLLTCEDDTVVGLNNGQWVRAGGEAGTLANFAGHNGYLTKSVEQFVLKGSALHKVLSTEMPPQIEANQAFTTNITPVAVDLSSDGRFFAFANDAAAYVYDKVEGSTTLRSYATYNNPTGQAINDVCFAFVDGQEMLLAAIHNSNTVHIIDHEDGCCFVRKLEPNNCPLDTPLRLATNHRGRVWVGCNAGRVVIFDV
jgi:hypothetical protein